MQPADVECDDCGNAAWWHSAHAALVCLECGTAIDSPGLERRATAHADGLARRKARASGTALAIEADPEAEARARAARVELHRIREYLERYADEMTGMCDGDAYERSQFARLAYELGATVRGYLPEIRQAPDTATCAVIWSELKEIRESDDYRQLVNEASEQNARIERAERAAEITAELERRREAEERRAAEQAAEERRQAEIRTRQLAAAQQQERRQLPAARKPPAPTNPYIQAGALIYDLTQQHNARKREQQDAIAQRGACGFCRKPTPAARVYGFGDYSGSMWPGTSSMALNEQRPHSRACARHYDNADQWMQQQARGATYYYWDLATVTA
jgi:hypothetical protein